jgi:hypothetical protein
MRHRQFFLPIRTSELESTVVRHFQDGDRELEIVFLGRYSHGVTSLLNFNFGGLIVVFGAVEPGLKA